MPVPEAITYGRGALFLAPGVLAQAIGVVIQVAANVIVLVGEGTVLALTSRAKRHFGTVKTCFDASLVLLATLLSLLLFGTVKGVRKGTPVSVIFVGMLAQALFRLKRWLLGHVFKTLHHG